ncbi:hypothetical protein F5I97DRAFT_1965034, partial [Phlebopus sp. FC_14]
MTDTVFWPWDVAQDGYIYGWRESNSLCVAGILDADTSQCREAKAVLQETIHSSEMQDLLILCGTPVILGYCTIRSFGPPAVPEIKTDVLNSTLTQPYRLLYYHRHAPRSQRFYVLDNNLPSTSSGRPDPLQAALAHDFTRRKLSSMASEGGQVMVNQWSSAKLLQDAIERGRTGKTSSPRSKERQPERVERWYRHSVLLGLRNRIKSSTCLLGILSKIKPYSSAGICPIPSFEDLSQRKLARQIEER